MRLTLITITALALCGCDTLLLDIATAPVQGYIAVHDGLQKKEGARTPAR